MRKFLTLSICLLCTFIYSQDSKNRVRGKVQSESSQSSLQNVHVLNLSKVVGTITDSEGVFEINASVADTLYFSYIGYKPLKIVVTNDLIKYENNIKFEEELEFLIKTLNNDNNSNYEKILILSNSPFKGHVFLKEAFNEEVNNYLKKLTTKNSNSLLSKVILPYVNVTPTSENIITNDIILKIKKIQSDIDKKDLENAFKKIKYIKEYKNIFKISSFEIDKYLNLLNRFI